MDEVRLIPVCDIIEPRSLLRLVDRDSIEYLELRDSVAQFGFTASVSVRHAREPGKYEIVDGVHRFSVARELELPAMPCIVKRDVTDRDLLVLQIQGNAQGVPTKPVEYARRIKAILVSHPEMGIDDLSILIKKSPVWIGVRLGLLELAGEIQKAVDRGDIPIASGVLLARMPKRLQRQHVDQAKTVPSAEFRRLAVAAIKHFEEAVAHGRLEDFYTREFTPQPYLRHLKEIQAELAHHQAGPPLLALLGCTTPLDGFYAALQWFIHLDPESIQAQQAAALARERNALQEPPDVNLN